MSKPSKYLYIGYEAKNNKFRVFLLKETETGMKPIMSYSDKIGLFFPYCASKPLIEAGKHVDVTWDGNGKIAEIKEA